MATKARLDRLTMMTYFLGGSIARREAAWSSNERRNLTDQLVTFTSMKDTIESSPLPVQPIVQSTKLNPDLYLNCTFKWDTGSEPPFTIEFKVDIDGGTVNENPANIDSNRIFFKKIVNASNTTSTDISRRSGVAYMRSTEPGLSANGNCVRSQGTKF